MKKLLFFIPFLVFADVDPFNVNTNNPNYMTPTEKAIYKNKKDINALKKELNSLKVNQAKKFTSYDIKLQQLTTKTSSFDNLVDEIGGLDKKLSKLKKDVLANKSSNEKLKQRIDDLENQLNQIKANLEKITKIQNENFNTLKKSIREILKAINNKPVHKKESLKDIFNRAKKAFEKKDYNTAKKLFTYTYNRGYYKATSAFYLGEIAYLKRLYKKALAFYKESVQLYPKKTSFSDRLLYHTGRSFMKLGQKRLAKVTFLKLIHDYPKSIYTKFAKKDLAKLN